MGTRDKKSILGYCIYCKDEIYEDEKHIVIGEDMYHTFCDRQMNTLYDPFDDGFEMDDRRDEND